MKIMRKITVKWGNSGGLRQIETVFSLFSVLKRITLSLKSAVCDRA